MAAVRLAIEKPGFSKGSAFGISRNDETASGGFGEMKRSVGTGQALSRTSTPRAVSWATAVAFCAVLMPVGQTNAPRATMAWRAIRIASSRSISVASTSLPSTPTAVSVPSGRSGRWS